MRPDIRAKIIGNLLPEDSRLLLPPRSSQVLLFMVFASFLLLPYIKIYIPAGLALLAALNCVRLNPSRYADKRTYVFLALILLLCCSALVSSYALPTGIQRGAGTVFLWFSFFVSGYCLSREIPRHEYYFLTSVPYFLFLGVGVMILLFYAGLADPFYDDGLYRFDFIKLRPYRLAVYAGLLLFFSCGGFVSAGNVRQQMFFLVTIVGLAGIILLASFRSTYFALVLPMALFAYKSRAPRKLKIALLVFLMGIVFCYIAFTSHERRAHLLAAVGNPLQVPSIVSRLPIWDTALNLIEQSPLSGYGLDSFRVLHPQYIAAHKEDLEKKYPIVEDAMPHTHNLLLGRLVEFGAVGTGIFLVLFGSGVVFSLRAPPRQFWLGCFMLFYCIAGLVDDPLSRAVDSYIYLFIGLACGLPAAKTAAAAQTAGASREPRLPATWSS